MGEWLPGAELTMEDYRTIAQQYVAVLSSFGLLMNDRLNYRIKEENERKQEEYIRALEQQQMELDQLQQMRLNNAGHTPPQGVGTRDYAGELSRRVARGRAWKRN